MENIPLFNGMSEQERNVISSIITEKSVPQNATIFMENMPSEAVYIILEGMVKVTRMIEEGEERTLSILHDGEFIGEMALVDRGPRMTTARALKPTRLLLIKNADFQNLFALEPKTCMKLIKAIIEIFSKRLRNADFIIKELLLSSQNNEHH